MPSKAAFGFSRGYIVARIELLTGTSARTFLAALAPGFTFVVEKVTYNVNIAHTGSSASQTIRLLKNAATVVATKAIILADTGTIGAIIDMPVTAANAEYTDADTLTVDMTASGTAFTAGTALVYIQYRELPQKKA